MSELHVLFPNAPERVVDEAELRSEEPLLPPEREAVACEPSGWSTFRTGFRHALLSGSNLYQTMALAAVLPILDVFGLFHGVVVIGLALPVFAVLTAINGDSRAERFWVGMGGPPAMRELGRMALDQLCLHGLGLFAWICAPDETYRWTLGTMWFISQALYGLAGLTRSLASTMQGRMLSLGALTTLTLIVATVPLTLIGWTSLFETLVAQSLVLALLAPPARLLLSGRWSSVGAERRRTAPTWLAAPLLFLAPLPYVLAEIPPVDVERTGVGPGVGRVRMLSEVGVPSASNFGWASSRYLWWFNAREGEREWERIPTRIDRPVDVQAHVSGAVFFFDAAPDDGSFGSAEVRAELVTADRDTVECTMPRSLGWTWWDDDGGGLTVIDRSGTPWRIDTDGCRPGTPIDRLPDRLNKLRFTATDDWTVVTRNFDGASINLLEGVQ